jgi:hypothetical protein
MTASKSGWSGKTFLSFVLMVLYITLSNKLDGLHLHNEKLSLMGLTLVVVLLIASIVLGHLAKKDIKKLNQRGGWLRLITLSLNYVMVAAMSLGLLAGLDLHLEDEDDRKVNAASTWVNSTGEAYVNSYYALVGDYPKSLQDLMHPPNGLPSFIKHPTDFDDPWGSTYRYEYPGKFNESSFDMWAVSPDGTVISNWKSD